jgi:hypothetical protein
MTTALPVPADRGQLATELSTELAEALDMLLSVATDERTRLPKGELFTDMALNGARQILDKARAAGVLDEGAS